MKCKPADIKRAKAMGCLHNRGTDDEFSVRVITENGTMTSEQLINIAQGASQFGAGRVAFTTRMTVELPGVQYESIPSLQAHLAQAGLETGGTGAKIRPVAACKGTTCVFGRIDTQQVAKMIHDRFYKGYEHVTLPHKFKIAVGGCPNNCVKPDLNDFGLVGQTVPQIDADTCRGCKKCLAQAGCQTGAFRLEGGTAAIDRSLCNNCGKCIESCVFRSTGAKEHGVKILIGGRWGRQGIPGVQVAGIYSIDQALDILEKALLVYRKFGFAHERFGNLVERMGLDSVEKLLLSDEILAQKEEILSMEIRERQ